jgi:ATP-binding cassette subfamily F protein uup
MKENNGNIDTKNNKPLKFSFKEQKEFEQIDDMIARLEDELKQISGKINSDSSDFERLQELIKKQDIMQKKLDVGMERWEYLNEIAERISNNKKDT